jgi:hypothetical protein
MKIRKLVALIIAAVFVCVLAVSPLPVKAAADITGPKLITFTPSKTSYVSGESVTFTITASDDSGVDPIRCMVGLRNSNDDAHFAWKELYFDNEITTPEEKENGQCTFLCSLPVNDHFPSGAYDICRVYLTDQLENTKEYSVNCPIIEITNTSRTDWKGPVIESLVVDKTTYNVGETVIFTLRASDPANVHGNVRLYDPGKNNVLNGIYFEPTETPGVVQGSFKVTALTQPGVYEISEMLLWDDLWNYSCYNNGGPDLPKAYNPSFTVINPNYSAGIPVVTSVKLSKTNLKPGETVHIEMTIDNKGQALKDYAPFLLYEYVELKKTAANVYSGDWTVPAFFQSRTLSTFAFLIREDNVQEFYCDKYNGHDFPTVKIISVFNGLEDKSVLVGSAPFDPRAGVTAANDTEGDLTGKIEVTGLVDTKKPGLYLLRYKIKSTQMGYKNGTYQSLYYYENRWIGVTEVMAGAGQSGPLAITDGTLSIGANASEVSVKRNGGSVAYAGAYSTAGKYTVKEKEGASAANALIDKTGTSVAYGISGKYNKIAVKINVTDACGLKMLKYLSGAQTAGKFLANGVDILKSKSFVAGKNGKFTVYAIDKLGNVTLKVIDVKFVPIKSLKFTRASVKVYKNKTIATGLKFSPSGATNKAVTYKSANTKIATVNAKGVIKGISKGKVKIYACATDGSGKKAIITVTVK